MSGLLMKAVIAITLALIFYTIGVWTEHQARLLKPVHLYFFWAGFVMDVTGTHMMSLLSEQGASQGMGIHGVTGIIAIVLMLIHAVWASAVLLRRDKAMQAVFHRFSLAVWAIWLIPFVIGMAMGMG